MQSVTRLRCLERITDQRRLHEACESGDLNFSLRHYGADMDVTGPRNDGWTPMFIACFYGHFEIVQWLHTHGAAMDVTRPRNDGSTPMLYACKNGHLEIVQWLHAHGAAMDVTRPRNDGVTPLWFACQEGHFEIVKWLHANGAAMDVTRPDNNGSTPMFIACQNGYLDIVQWLHVHGAAMDVTRSMNNGATPMFIACQNAHFEVVRWLLTHGADTDVMRPTWQGMTSMDFACQQGYLNIVQHLICHHRMSPDTLEQWHPRLSSSNKIQLCQAARENLFDCQSFLTLATIVRYINIEPYQVMNEETGRLVIPRNSILIFRRRNQHLLWSVANYICGGEETRHIWHLIRKKQALLAAGHYGGQII